MPKIGTNTHSRYYKMFTPLTVDKIVRFIKEVRGGEERDKTEEESAKQDRRTRPHAVWLLPAASHLTDGLRCASFSFHLRACH